MKKIGLVLAAAIIVVVGFAATQQKAQNTDKMPVRSIPELEAERLSREPVRRDDTGRLSAEEFAMQREAISTRSTFFVMEGVKSSSAKLPITSESAKIAFFSPTDGELDVQLIDPAGKDMTVVPHVRNSSAGSEMISNLTVGRGNVQDGVLLISDKKQLNPGLYIANIRKSKTPVDIIVNDEGGVVMNMWLSDNGLDNSEPITLNAKLVDVDGKSAIYGAQLSANLRGSKGKAIPLTENEPGVYSAKINASKINGMSTFIVEAKGNTNNGLRFMRTGGIDAIAGKANAKLIGIGSETLTDADLLVEVNINVTAQGRYYVRGNIVSDNNDPIAWAQNAGEFAPGQHTLTLKFDRNVLNQSGFTGGFKLTDVELMNTTDMPGIKAPKRIKDFFLKSSL